jgi:tetratricopeptide (TPR) repeat protein
MTKMYLTICLLALACVCGCSSMVAKTSQLSASRGTESAPPTHSLRVLEVFPNGPAAAAGIEPMDAITQYGTYQIVDRAGLYTAKNHYEDARAATVGIVVWRGRSRMTAEIRTGWLGVTTTENDRASHEFSSLMMQINALSEIPKYQRDHEFKVQFKEGTGKILEQATALVDKAERESTWTPAQLLVARIYMILNDAPKEEQKRQQELLSQLMETQPLNYIHMLGNDRFFKDKRYRPAIACFQRYLKTSPDDVPIRLNLAVAYNMIEMYDDAEAAVDYVFDHKLKLSEYGQLVGYQNKALAALGRKNYSSSIQFAEKAFDLRPEPYPLMLIQLAGAQTGDVVRVEEAIQRLQTVLPAEYLEMNLQIEAVLAYAMVKNNQRDAAIKLVKKWKDTDRPEGRIANYFQSFPEGTDIVKNWREVIGK